MTGEDGRRPATESSATLVASYLVARGTSLRLRHWCGACVHSLTTVCHFFQTQRSDNSTSRDRCCSLSSAFSLSLSCSSPLRQAHQSLGPVTIRLERQKEEHYCTTLPTRLHHQLNSVKENDNRRTLDYPETTTTDNLTDLYC